MRGHHHQDRQHPGVPGPDGYPHFREPQIALGLVAGFVTDPVGRLRRGILWPDPAHVLPEPGRGPGPAHPLGQHRCRPRGFSLSSARRAGSTALIPESCGARAYVGGPSALTAFATVFREIPSRAAIDLIDAPSARCNRRISAQSSTVITHPIVWNDWLSFQPHSISSRRNWLSSSEA
jgi:hypothetical protein